MTAAELAAHLNARRSGQGRWQARCPAHDDRSPSLSIKEGRDGRVLVNCWAGCVLTSVLKACGLGLRDLFPGPPPAPGQLAELARKREAKAAKRMLERDALQRLQKRLRELEAIRNALGGLLARSAEDDGLARLFEAAEWRVHDADTKLAMKSQRAASGGPREVVQHGYNHSTAA